MKLPRSSMLHLAAPPASVGLWLLQVRLRVARCSCASAAAGGIAGGTRNPTRCGGQIAKCNRYYNITSPPAFAPAAGVR
jgi:hypothetical protein